jgi:hypothetical protein
MTYIGKVGDLVFLSASCLSFVNMIFSAMFFGSEDPREINVRNAIVSQLYIIPPLLVPCD